MKNSFITIGFLLAFLNAFPQGDTCSNAEPFCSDTAFVFPNTFSGVSAEVGPDYGCLRTQPNPAWYFLGVANVGDIDLTISQEDTSGVPIDVDFICYGPFSDVFSVCNGQLTAANTIACSYLPLTTESFTINNAQVGDFYLVLITNFEGLEGQISFEQTNVGQTGSGETDCSIVCDVSLQEDQFFCDNNQFTIVADVGNNSVAANATYKWYKNNILMSTETSQTLVVNSLITSTDTYKVIVSATICDDDVEDEITISYIQQSTTSIPNDFFNDSEPLFLIDETVVYCEDNYPNNDYLAIDLLNNDVNDYTYNWSNGETSNSIAVNTENDYTVDIFNPINCKTLTKTFHVLGSIVFNVIELDFIDEEIYYCINDYPSEITLNVGIENNPITDYTIRWYNETNDLLIDYPNTNNIPDLNINQSGIYTVEVFNSDFCSVKKTITVLPSEAPTFKNVLVTENKFYKKVSIIIKVTGQGDYEYAIDSDVNYQDANYFDNISYGLHTVYIRDKNGCGIIQEEITLLEYPKFITPNNDGVYDTWNINNINAINNNFNTITNIIIFDRYGKVMANINPNGLGWDGNYLGNPAPSSTYWFSVNLIDFRGKLITKKGYFSLNR